jgi:hypothetical protein
MPRHFPRLGPITRLGNDGARVREEEAAASSALVPLREERVDLPRQVRDLLCQLLVLHREVGVRLEQLEDLVGLSLRRSLESAVVLVDSFGTDLVAVRLARLRKQDQRCCVRGLE